MSQSARVWRALVAASVLESARRKDIYVVVVLTLVMVAGAWAFGFFGVHGLEVFIRDVSFAAIGIFSTVLTVMIAARQIPEDIQRRTIYLLLARPITRWQLMVGKWLGASLTAILAFLLLVFVARVLLMAFGIPISPIFYQYILLKMLGLIWLSALTVGLSVFTTPAATITICLILAFGSGLFDRLTLLLHGNAALSGVGLNLLTGLMPHYDLFDLGAKVTYEWPPVPTWVLGAMAAYCVVSSMIWLSIGWLRFRKQAI